MRRIFALLLTLTLCLGLLALPAAAADSAQVLVTISSAGELVLTRETVAVTDVDGDGALTINDALFCAHEAHYEGGAEAGYASGMTDYGLSLNLLWGVDNGGSYGYRVNNASAWSLADPVKDGDHVYAYSYADLTAWSDAYTVFDRDTYEVALGQTLEVTVSSYGYDADWNEVLLPAAGAAVSAGDINAVADDEGRAALTFDKAGTYLLTASSDTATLVPPVAVVTVRSFPDTVNHWAADAIEDVAARGLFSGTGKGFAPGVEMDRAMLVTVLYRLEGKPAVESKADFADVAGAAWYADAVAWASAEGIITGYEDGSFRPTAPVTRQQLAAILHRYAVSKGCDVSVGEDTDILSYADAPAISAYAIPAMRWACGAGLISGVTTDTLAPNSGATRAQVAVILGRFVSNVK